jgi:hypothetical protein
VTTGVQLAILGFNWRTKISVHKAERIRSIREVDQTRQRPRLLALLSLLNVSFEIRRVRQIDKTGRKETIQRLSVKRTDLTLSRVNEKTSLPNFSHPSVQTVGVLSKKNQLGWL